MLVLFFVAGFMDSTCFFWRLPFTLSTDMSTRRRDPLLTRGGRGLNFGRAVHHPGAGDRRPLAPSRDAGISLTMPLAGRANQNIFLMRGITRRMQRMAPTRGWGTLEHQHGLRPAHDSAGVTSSANFSGWMHTYYTQFNSGRMLPIYACGTPRK